MKQCKCDVMTDGNGRPFLSTFSRCSHRSIASLLLSKCAPPSLSPPLLNRSTAFHFDQIPRYQRRLGDCHYFIFPLKGALLLPSSHSPNDAPSLYRCQPRLGYPCYGEIGGCGHLRRSVSDDFNIFPKSALCLRRDHEKLR